MGAESKHLRILQVYNISTAASNDFIKQLFQYFGRIEEFQVYPIIITVNTKQKVAYVRYEREHSVNIAQHLTNTVFFDRALVCVPATSNTIPDEDTALQSSAALGKKVLPPHVTNEIRENEHGQKMLYTLDPNLTDLGLPPYPPLGADLDPEKVEQTRRTIYVGNIKKEIDPNDIIKFFNNIGEVMYLRMASTTDNDDCDYCYIEFTDQASVPQALQNDGVEFQGQPIRIQHSRVAIVKPQQKTSDQALEEIEEAMKRRDKGERSPRKRSRSFSPKNRKRGNSPAKRGGGKDYDRDRRRDSGRGGGRDNDRRRGRSDRSTRRRSRDRDYDRDRRDRDKVRGGTERERDRTDRDRDSKRSKDSREDRDDSRRREKGRSRDKDRDQKRSPRARDADPSRSRSIETRKRREDPKVEAAVETSEAVEPVSVKNELDLEPISDNSGQSPEVLENTLRERLLAKQMGKKRLSDEMDISE